MKESMRKVRDLAREAAMQRKALGLSVIKNPLERLAETPTSLRRAITAKCYQCEGEDADPGVRWRIGNCEIADCALHGLRPYQDQTEIPIPKVLASSWL